MPGRPEALGLRETVLGARAQVHRRRVGIVHQCVAAGVTDAGACGRAEEGVRMPHRSHVEHRRHAARQTLGQAEAGRDRHGLGIVRRLARPHVPFEPRKQLETRRSVSQKRLAQMEVRLNETGNDPFAPGGETLDRLAGK